MLRWHFFSAADFIPFSRRGCVLHPGCLLTVLLFFLAGASAQASDPPVQTDTTLQQVPTRTWQSSDAAQWQSREWTVMTTRAFVEFRSDDADVIRNTAIFDAITAELERINAVFSPWLPGSELARINRLAAREPVAASAEMFDLFRKSDDFFRLTHGAFDPSFAAAGRLYDFRRQQAPDATALAAAQEAVGWQHVVLDSTQQSIQYLHPDTRVDFGGIAKGHAIDRVLAILKSRGVTDAYIALGGDSYALGTRNGRPWQIGIRHPRNAAAAPVMVPASNLAVSTSGDYERFFERDGERIHHILSPQSGRPVHGVLSVTILADDSTTADALSTGVFVLGVEKGLALVNRLESVSAIVITDDGRLHYSNDLVSAAP